MNPDRFGEYAAGLMATIAAVPNMEFIFQLNEETQPVFDIVSATPPANMSVLYDASCGKGIEITSLADPSGPVPCGYAGGIGPDNIGKILNMVSGLEQTGDNKKVWIDMESSLRVTRSDKQVRDQDAFSVDKCFACIDVCVSLGLPVAL
jgi:phosphoribosylanthranilate isomerase